MPRQVHTLSTKKFPTLNYQRILINLPDEEGPDFSRSTTTLTRGRVRPFTSSFFSCFSSPPLPPPPPLLSLVPILPSDFPKGSARTQSMIQYLLSHIHPLPLLFRDDGFTRTPPPGAPPAPPCWLLISLMAQHRLKSSS